MFHPCPSVAKITSGTPSKRCEGISLRRHGTVIGRLPIKCVAFTSSSTNHSVVRLAVSLPVSLAVGIGAGFAFFRGPAALSPAETTALLKKEMSTNAAAWPDSPAATDAKAQRLIAAALRKGGRIERESEMYLAIETFTTEDFHRLVADAGALKAMAGKLKGIDWQTSRNLASALIGRWLAVDPGTVMTWAPRVLELIPAKENARGLILDALAAKRPAELLALVPSRKDAAERADIISRGLRELAAQDPAKARAWLDACTDPADRRVAERAMRFGTVQTDPLRAIELAGSIENRQEGRELLNAAAGYAAKMGTGVLRHLATTPMKPWMLSTVVGELAESEPVLAVDLVMKTAGDGESNAFGFQLAFSALARRDPAQAIAKLEGLAGMQLAAAVSAIGYDWAAREPAAALAWLAERPASERADPNRGRSGSNDALLIGFADWAENARTDARAWADALPAGTTHDAVQTQLARVLASRGEPAEATQVLARLGRAAEPKALADIAGAWARRDPQAAADWAIAQEAGPVQSRALAQVVGIWANDNPRGVEDWLAQFPPGEARDRSVAAFLWRNNAWTVGRDERIAEFDAWFDLIDDPFRRAQAATSSFWQRKERDPAGARAWLSSLPNVDAEVIRMTLRNERN